MRGMTKEAKGRIEKIEVSYFCVLDYELFRCSWGWHFGRRGCQKVSLELKIENIVAGGVTVHGRYSTTFRHNWSIVE